jgi:hypothetical protein
VAIPPIFLHAFFLEPNEILSPMRETTTVGDDHWRGDQLSSRSIPVGTFVTAGGLMATVAAFLCGCNFIEAWLRIRVLPKGGAR